MYVTGETILKRMFFYCLLMSLTVNVFAVSHKMDCHSKSVTAKHMLLILNVQKENAAIPRLYFIKNKSKEGLWVNHPSLPGESAKAGWASFIKPQHWSALLLTKPNFAINCGVIAKDNISYFNCRKFIDVCESGEAITAKNTGSYWLIENQPENTFFDKVAERLKTSNAN